MKVESKGETYYLAQALCDTVLGEGEYTVLEQYKGADLGIRNTSPCSILCSPRRNAGMSSVTIT